jgi:predicted ATPase
MTGNQTAMIPRIRLVQIKNYKSLEAVSVELEPFTVFVGSNGSGKSNFLDALAFVQECVSESVELALRNRGGLDDVMARFVDDMPIVRAWLVRDAEVVTIPASSNLAVRLVVDLEEDLSGDYAFELAWTGRHSFEVVRERCVLRAASEVMPQFEIRDATFVNQPSGIAPVVLRDRLQLPLLAGIPALRPLWDFLVSMRTYAIRPETIREYQTPDSGAVLKHDGSNTPSVLTSIAQKSPPQPNVLGRIIGLLSHVAEGITDVSVRQVGAKETVWFQQDMGAKKPFNFDAVSMSDGTLRVLGLLLALLQPFPKVVGIEEPEATIHPAIAEMVMEVLMDASEEKQVLITTHSPDLLDQKELKDHQIRVVALRNGRTVITPMSEGGRQAIRERLYTPGQLLRMGELNVDQNVVSQRAEEMDLFGEPSSMPARES